MADEVRAYIQAAQQAENRGEKAQAVDLLMKAAALYRSAGNNSRALQMLRHACRLDSSRADLQALVRRLEWLPDRTLAKAVSADEDDETERALAPLTELVEDGPKLKELVERGPTRADPSLQAWCSFCCRPKSEVGELVAGASSAFICQHCVGESRRLLGMVDAVENPVRAVLEEEATEPQPVAPLPPAGAPEVATQSPPPPPAESKASSSSPTAGRVVGQEEAERIGAAVLELGMSCVLVVGPAGSGKSEWLRGMEARGLGRYVRAPADALTAVPAGQRLLVDELESLAAEELDELGARLAAISAPVWIAVRGEVAAPSRVAVKDGTELPLYSTQQIVTASGGRLPLSLAERVQAVVPFRALGAPALAQIASALLSSREGAAQDGLAASLAEEAAASGRGAHELKALVARLPAGWTLRGGSAAPAEKKKRSRRKGTAP